MNVSTQCSCGLVTIANIPSIHHHDDMNDAGYYAIVRWTTEDVHTHREQRELSKWTDKEAEDWLRSMEGNIQDRMIERGWDSIYELMDDDA